MKFYLWEFSVFRLVSISMSFNRISVQAFPLQTVQDDLLIFCLIRHKNHSVFSSHFVSTCIIKIWLSHFIIIHSLIEATYVKTCIMCNKLSTGNFVFHLSQTWGNSGLFAVSFSFTPWIRIFQKEYSLFGGCNNCVTVCFIILLSIIAKLSDKYSTFFLSCFNINCYKIHFSFLISNDLFNSF